MANLSNKTVGLIIRTGHSGKVVTVQTRGKLVAEKSLGYTQTT